MEVLALDGEDTDTSCVSAEGEDERVGMDLCIHLASGPCSFIMVVVMAHIYDILTLCQAPF